MGDAIQENCDFIRLVDISPVPIALTTIYNYNGRIIDRFITTAEPNGLVVTR
jgi:hypothetical protein